MIPALPIVIAHVRFADGSTRDVYREGDGSQFVIGDEFERVYGVWYYEPEADEPVVVGER